MGSVHGERLRAVAWSLDNRSCATGGVRSFVDSIVCLIRKSAMRRALRFNIKASEVSSTRRANGSSWSVTLSSNLGQLYQSMRHREAWLIHQA
jgi:hypothetical protein